MAEVLIEGRRLDVFEGFSFSFNYGIADVRDPNKRSTEYSKTIKCPSTANNDKLFGHIYDVNVANSYNPSVTNIGVNFNPNKKASAIVLADSFSVMTGVVQLRQITIEQSKYVYEVVFIGKLINLFAKLGDKELNGSDLVGNVREYYLDFSEFDHTYNRPNQVASWTAPKGDGYVYPMIDFGGWFEYTNAGQRVYRVNDFRPAIYAKEILDKIFDYAGFTYTSTFLNSALFKSLCVPVSSSMRLGDAASAERSFKAVKSIDQMLHRAAASFSNTFGNEQKFVNSGLMSKLCFEDDSNLGFDNNNQYLVLSTPNNLYNFNAVGNYVFKCQEPQRHDTFRASVDFTLKENYAFSAGTIYEGTLEIVKEALDGTIYIVGSTDWSWTLTGNVGTTHYKTFYVEGDALCWSGDQVYVRLNSDPNVNGYKNIYGVKLGSTVYLNYKAVNGYFENEPIQTQIFEGDTVVLSENLPDMGMSEFVMSLINMFNLYVTVDEQNEFNLIVETYDEFYSSGKTKDWTYKLARDKTITIQPLGLLTAREYNYTYKEDGDFYNERYQSNRGHAYGRRKIEIDNDFITRKQETKIGLSPSPLVNDEPSNRIIPKVYDSDMDEGAKPTDMNTRILYYGGLIPSNPSWMHKDGGGSIETFVYPYAGHWDNPITPTLDINFGLPHELYYAGNQYTGTLQMTNANLYNVYHRKQVEEVTNKDSKVLTASFRLTPLDINKLDFRDQILIDNSYWRLNKVMNYNPFKEGLTRVELTKVKEVLPISNESFRAGVSGTIGKGGLAEFKPAIIDKLLSNENQFPASNGSVSGFHNIIDYSTNNFKVIGDGNLIKAGSSNITILGNNNTVNGGLQNVHIVNSDNVIATESNVTYINGIKSYQISSIDGGGDGVSFPRCSKSLVRLIDGGLNTVQEVNEHNLTNLIDG